MVSTRGMAQAVISGKGPQHFMATSGETDPVWVHTEPYSSRPQFPKLAEDLSTDVCIVGAGISGIQSAYELVTRGHNVVMLEAREVLSGETGRTSGHLASALDDGYTEIAKTHGTEGAALAAESHSWALNRVGEVSKQLNIDCEYRKLPGYQISQYPRADSKHDDEVKMLREEVAKAKEIGMDVKFEEGFAVKGWDGQIDQRDAAIFNGQATFHPTKYLVALLKWLKEQPNFKCFSHTRVMDTKEKGIEVLGMGSKTVHVSTDDGHTVTCGDVIMATCVPVQKLSVVADMEYMRTYCVAMKAPKGYIEDCLLYDAAEIYKYIRLTECDAGHDYVVVGGCDHKVGQEEPTGRFEELETWTRERFTKVGPTEYAWSGQVFEPVDYMAFIGKNPGNTHTYIVTGDSGNGLTHGVLAGRLIADEIENVDNPWAKIYNPKRVASIAKHASEMLSHDLQINAQYKRFLHSDIKDIEDLPNGEGGVLNPTFSSPTAVYKDDEGKVHKFSALCPHLKGVVCWNRLEKSWDCPIHASRFSKDGVCIMGPAKGNLAPADEAGSQAQGEAVRNFT